MQNTKVEILIKATIEVKILATISVPCPSEPTQNENEVRATKAFQPRPAANPEIFWLN